LIGAWQISVSAMMLMGMQRSHMMQFSNEDWCALPSLMSKSVRAAGSVEKN
jgi:hypothetical protein